MATPQGISKEPLPLPRLPILRSSFPCSVLEDELQAWDRRLRNTYIVLRHTDLRCLIDVDISFIYALSPTYIVLSLLD